jgi:uncharacterized protein DUF4386
VKHEQQLDWERRMGRVAGAAALVTLVLSIVFLALQGSALRDTVEDSDRSLLLEVDGNSSTLIGASAVQVATQLLLIVVLVFLYRVTKYRRPQTPSVAQQLAILGPLLYSAGSVFLQLDLLNVADDFVSSGPQTEARAEQLMDDRTAVPVFIGLAGQLALAFAMVTIHVNAMRAGTISRFLGIIGIILGVLFVVPFLGPVVIQIFWLGALAAIFLGIWPGGRGPAWESGEAEPWPSAMEKRQLALREAQGEAPAEPAEPEAPPERPASRKKRRRG